MQPQPGQTNLAQAVNQVTTMGLILAVPQTQFLETCPACGNQQNAGGKFCMHCGARLRCPNCGTPSLGKNYCHECGKSLRQ